MQSSEVLLTVMPSFQPPLTIKVTVPSDPSKPSRLVKTLNLFSEDAAQTTLTLAPKQRAKLEELLEAIRDKYPPATIDGLDGVSFSLAVSRGTEPLELEWWGAVPKAWAGVADLVDELMRLGDSCPG